MTTTWQKLDNKNYTLPCGCCFEGDIDNTPAPADPQPAWKFCPTHAAAPDMLEALQAITRGDDGSHERGRTLVATITKATEIAS